jgi:hypothetical protein
LIASKVNYLGKIIYIAEAGISIEYIKERCLAIRLSPFAKRRIRGNYGHSTQWCVLVLFR